MTPTEKAQALTHTKWFRAMPTTDYRRGLCLAVAGAQNVSSGNLKIMINRWYDAHCRPKKEDTKWLKK